MVLSRFWLIIFISSLVFVFLGLALNKEYSLDRMVNGTKESPILIGESYFKELPKSLRDSLVQPEGKVSININPKDADTTYERLNDQVKLYSGVQKTDGLLPTAKNTITDIILPLLAYLALFAGLMQLLIDSGAAEGMAKWLSPFFVKVFPSVPKNHPSISYMTLNFAANFLGLDSAATPFGLKAMESLQEINPDKERASDAQIMFLCLHAAGLTLIPTSIIGYRAAAHAASPADVMLPCIVTSFIGTLAALIIVGIRQKVNLLNRLLIAVVFGIVGAMLGLLFYINSLDVIAKNHFTGNFSGVLLLGIIVLILGFAFYKERRFKEQKTTIFDSFVVGAKNGMQTAVTIFPYVLGMLVAISVFRNSGLFEVISQGITWVFSHAGLSKEITDSLPVAMLRPFSSGGSRGFMLDAMNVYGPDSFTGRLSCIFQCSAETTFYVVAVYFGAAKVSNTRYTLSTMLLVDLICVIAAIFVASWFF
ncbi:MAG: spore maturation protein [Flavobacteriia bacterium]|nr:spore maturation protein [Flavobacteriia bacterium]